MTRNTPASPKSAPKPTARAGTAPGASRRPAPGCARSGTPRAGRPRSRAPRAPTYVRTTIPSAGPAGSGVCRGGITGMSLTRPAIHTPPKARRRLQESRHAASAGATMLEADREIPRRPVRSRAARSAMPLGSRRCAGCDRSSCPSWRTGRPGRPARASHAARRRAASRWPAHSRRLAPHDRFAERGRERVQRAGRRRRLALRRGDGSSPRDRRPLHRVLAGVPRRRTPRIRAQGRPPVAQHGVAIEAASVRALDRVGDGIRARRAAAAASGARHVGACAPRTVIRPPRSRPGGRDASSELYSIRTGAGPEPRRRFACATSTP